MNKKEIISKVKFRLLEKYTAKNLLPSEEIINDCIDNTLKAINYTRCSLQLLCVNSSVDGLTAGKYYKKLYQDRTHTKVLDDYGIETMYFSDRFIKPPSQQ